MPGLEQQRYLDDRGSGRVPNAPKTLATTPCATPPEATASLRASARSSEVANATRAIAARSITPSRLDGFPNRSTTRGHAVLVELVHDRVGGQHGRARAARAPPARSTCRRRYPGQADERDHARPDPPANSGCLVRIPRLGLIVGVAGWLGLSDGLGLAACARAQRPARAQPRPPRAPSDGGSRAGASAAALGSALSDAQARALPQRPRQGAWSSPANTSSDSPSSGTLSRSPASPSAGR